MANMLFNFPKSAFFGRTIPKSKFYEHGSVTSKQKDLFIKQVDEIIWEYKLAPETVNLSSTSGVPELQIFKIILKGEEISEEVLRCIDQAVMFPIVFEVFSYSKVKMIAAFKRRNEANSNQWVLNEYGKTDWLDINSERAELHYSLNLGSIYEQILKSLTQLKARPTESLHEYFERDDLVKKKMSELKKIENKLKTEKQFNKKVELNTRLRNVKSDVEQLTA
ncbi:DUF4391 domain-containing protein [Polynucleobacter sinensis]|uniref:DUF4391 domain-containing protein n=1 Tax=Polynucleobacter sinensis TaxID=1743157 RepID=UPI000781B9EB|nr:DUF4391 domain-containing protein [Polynucleobacter sinensis]